MWKFEAEKKVNKLSMLFVRVYAQRTVLIDILDSFLHDWTQFIKKTFLKF